MTLHASDGTARGSSHTSEYPWLSSPAAELKRERMFSSATIWVSSTTAGAPSCSIRWAVISSVTVSGVVLIASAYSRTSRSSGVKTSDSRHRGTSRTFARSRPSLCAMK